MFVFANFIWQTSNELMISKILVFAALAGMTLLAERMGKSLSVMSSGFSGNIFWHPLAAFLILFSYLL